MKHSRPRAADYPSAHVGREIAALAEHAATTGRHLIPNTEAARWIADNRDAYDAMVNARRATP